MSSRLPRAVASDELQRSRTYEEEPTDTWQRLTTAHFAGLELDSVRKSFQGVVALRGVNLRVPFGQIHGLIGENGAGKSTLVKVLAGKVMADTGTLSIDGRAGGHYRDDARATYGDRYGLSRT